MAVDLREHIIMQSLRLFSLKGFLATSLHDIQEATGTSKGGFYNHFRSKEDLLLAVLSQARKLWRERNLTGIEETASPLGRVKRILENYRDRYLKDTEHFPGGCVFVALSVELDDQRPRLGREISEGFTRLRALIRRLLDQARQAGELAPGTDTEALAEMIFAGMIGSSVLFSMEKSSASLDRMINSLMGFLDRPTRGDSLRFDA